MIKGIMSESLHIKGIMSKEFSAIRCLDFNGSTDYVDCGNDLSLNITDAITIETWGKIETVQDSYIVDKGNYRFKIQNGNYLRGLIWVGGVMKAAIGTPGEVLSGIPHHTIMTYDKNDGTNHIKLFLNRQEVNYTNQDDTGGGAIDGNASRKLYLGIYNESSSCLDGKIYINRIYNKALNATERQNNFNGKITQDGLVAEWLMREQKGNIIHDTSVNSNTGTIHGADWYEEKFNTPLKGIMSNSSEIKGIMTAEYI